jgi:xyloglucan-specific endo-beta-1,4-glucanase
VRRRRRQGADGKPVPIGSATLAGQTWDVYKGPNGQMTVFSFLPRQETRSFSGDLKVFYDYLVKQQGFPSSQYLISAGAGTEPFVGEGVTFTTSKYSFGIK